ncbi:MAG: VWA domain-containing protein [Treponema sp.]|jgi:Mg-chelatase subunit ChlD|nr:VWA domain-containing protein [Treponema sp.]
MKQYTCLGLWCLLFALLGITPLIPQNRVSFDKTAVLYTIQQIRYVEQREKPALKAGEETTVSISVHPGDAIALDRVPDDLVREAEAVMETAPRNICLVIDISGSMGDAIRENKTRFDLVQEVCETIVNKVLKEKDVVSVIGFHYGHKLVIKHFYIRNAQDRKELIEAIKTLKPEEKANTFMRQALSAAYTVINELGDTGPYTKHVLLLTDGEQIEDRDPTETKALVNDLVRTHKAAGIGTAVSTVAFFDPAAIAHMEEVAALGGGSSIFVENEEKQPALASLVSLLNNEVTSHIKRLWKDRSWEVRLVLSDGVSLKVAESYTKEAPLLQGNTLSYPRMRLGKPIILTLSLSERVVQKKAAILSLSVRTSDARFSLVEDYPLSLNNPVRVDSETGFVTFTIKKYTRVTL